ncbi:MAG: CBS domain-containing protein [Oscillospiraceae bacterium]|nr:CBS domain-containing protein [Oscillospiraceae bacterium]
MNIAKIMIPRACTVFLNEKQTVRQGWEVMTRNGYTAIPVLDAEQRYIGCVSEGDFLRHILDTGSLDKMEMENHRVRELVRRDFCPPLSIDADEGDVIRATLNQNFVPIVDSRNTLCGILTRRGVIAHLAEKDGILSNV